MSEVVYARVPRPLKEAVRDHASGRSLSLTGAVADLVEHGLEAIANEASVEALERKLTVVARELEKTRARLQEAELRVQAAGEREQIIASTFRAVAERSRQELASCQTCRTRVRGSDLFVSGRCPSCARPLTSLLTPTPRAGLDSTEYIALMGALGVLVGLALASSPDDAGPERPLVGR